MRVCFGVILALAALLAGCGDDSLFGGTATTTSTVVSTTTIAPSTTAAVDPAVAAEPYIWIPVFSEGRSTPRWAPAPSGAAR